MGTRGTRWEQGAQGGNKGPPLHLVCNMLCSQTSALCFSTFVGLSTFSFPHRFKCCVGDAVIFLSLDMPMDKVYL